MTSRASSYPRDHPAGERLQSLVDRLVAKKRIPHAVLGVSHGDGSSRWVGAAGDAYPDGTPMRSDTPYFIASVTKLHIATLILQLVEEGKVFLDEPMVSYLPSGSVDGIHRLKGVDYTGQVTVRNLLGHTSGLPDYLEDKRSGQPSMYDELSRSIDRGWGFDDVVRITRDEQKPRFPPQDPNARKQKARYSDTGFQLLIAIIEHTTGDPFHRVLEQRIFNALGLRDTWLPGGTDPPAGQPPVAMLWSKGSPIRIPQAIACFNDLVGTADDSLRFMRALIGGELFQQPSTVDLMQQRWNRIFYPMQYGLGMMRYPINRLFAPGWKPVTLIGHSGATGSWLFYCPEMDVYLAGTVDDAHARTLPFRFMLSVLRTVHR
jgi:D-alanyl-D-alanine carboxypeptidase